MGLSYSSTRITTRCPSTLEAYFQGKKELFEGLAVEKLEKDWIKYPILHLDLNIEKYDTSESLDNILDKSLTAWEKLYGAEPSETARTTQEVITSSLYHLIHQCCLINIEITVITNFFEILNADRINFMAHILFFY